MYCPRRCKKAAWLLTFLHFDICTNFCTAKRYDQGRFNEFSDGCKALCSQRFYNAHFSIPFFAVSLACPQNGISPFSINGSSYYSVHENRVEMMKHHGKKEETTT